MKTEEEVIQWFLEGDPAVRWQMLRDLTDADEIMIARERAKIDKEGWGAKLLAYQEDSGLWADGLYSPKWTSTTYTMLLLRRLGLDPENVQAQKGCRSDNDSPLDG